MSHGGMVVEEGDEHRFTHHFEEFEKLEEKRREIWGCLVEKLENVYKGDSVRVLKHLRLLHALSKTDKNFVNIVKLAETGN